MFLRQKMINMKKCSKCGDDKPLEEFSIDTKSGERKVLPACKKCRTDKYHQKMQSPEYRDKESARGREKYSRLNYKERARGRMPANCQTRKVYEAKYPEKIAAKAAIQSIRNRRKKGVSLHHWNYNTEYHRDVIEMQVSDHYLLHRHIRYDQPLKLYRTKSGELLTSRESHIELLNTIKNGTE